jgi:hypothetical protein
VLITLAEVDTRLRQALQQAKAHLCDEDDTDRLRRFLFHERGFNVECIGRDAAWIAKECGIRIPHGTLVLLAPILQVGVEEPLAQEKLCPVLAYHVVQNRDQAIAQARAVLRLAGAGHSAALHTHDESVAMAFAAAVEVYRVVLNAPCTQGAAGFQTALAPTFTVGTGFFGHSSVGENVGPKHLLHWTRLAYNSDPSEAFGQYHGLGTDFSGPLPEAPADGVPGARSARPSAEAEDELLPPVSRAELRRMIAEELRAVLGK